MGVFVIGEIGINHNGEMELCKKLILGAKEAGADAVKFQKRSLDRVYSQEDLDRPRESPWGATNREQKKGLEFEKPQFDEIHAYCKKIGIEWFASAWDLESQKFLEQYETKYNKIASPRITHLPLLEKVAEEGKYTFISTGMSTLDEIKMAVDIFRKKDCPFELMHCTSTYPMPPEQANLRCIETLRREFACKVGYSGHETGLQISLAAVALGASSLERHITLDRAMYGSDQAASVELAGFKRLIRDIRVIEVALGDGEKRIWDEEYPIRKKLRRDDDITV